MNSFLVKFQDSDIIKYSLEYLLKLLIVQQNYFKLFLILIIIIYFYSFIIIMMIYFYLYLFTINY